MDPADSLEALTAEYRAIAADPSQPFPKLETSKLSVPTQELLPVEVKTGFVALLEQSQPEVAEGEPQRPAGFVRLMFPEGTDELVVPRACVATDLVDAAVAKVNHWLSNGRNAAYAEGKLVALMRGSEAVVRRLVEEVAQRPRMAAAKVHEPDELGYKFWTYLANLILADLKAKKDKTLDDHGACQSAWIIGYVVFWRKGKRMQEEQRAADRKSLEVLVRKPPYLFSLDDLYDLKDPKGVPFSVKHSRDFIHAFVKETTRPGETEHLPFLVRLSALGHEYYVQRDLAAPVFLQKLSESGPEIRAHYLDDWTARLRRFERAKSMRADDPFRREVEILVKEQYPLLAALANAPLLLLARSETAISETVRSELGRCLQRDGSLRPLADLLALSRPKLLREARAGLPLWMSIPIVCQVVRLLRRLAQGRASRQTTVRTLADEERQRQAAEALEASRARREGRTRRRVTGGMAEVVPSGGPAPKGESLARYKRAIAALRDRAVPEGMSLEAALAQLAEKWNPLYAEEQKRNLVEDVNSLARDFLRSLRRGFMVSPPTMERLHELAARLASSRNLEKIKKKEPLLRYLELYLIKCLQLKR